MDLLTYDELRVIERGERSGNKLTELSSDFLDRYQAYIIDKQRVLDKSDDNVIAKKVKERTKKELINARNSFKNIIEYRAKKVFEQVVIDLRMGVKPEHKGLLLLEKDLYNKLRALLTNHFNQLIKRKLKKEGVAQPIIKDDNVLVRFVNDLPEFVWNDLVLGPFRAEDMANLPNKVVKLLLSKGVIKEVLN